VVFDFCVEVGWHLNLLPFLQTALIRSGFSVKTLTILSPDHDLILKI
jgi:hypothetical protein